MISSRARIISTRPSRSGLKSGLRGVKSATPANSGSASPWTRVSCSCRSSITPKSLQKASHSYVRTRARLSARRYTRAISPRRREHTEGPAPICAAPVLAQRGFTFNGFSSAQEQLVNGKEYFRHDQNDDVPLEAQTVRAAHEFQ